MPQLGLVADAKLDHSDVVMARWERAIALYESAPPTVTMNGFSGGASKETCRGRVRDTSGHETCCGQ